MEGAVEVRRGWRERVEVVTGREVASVERRYSCETLMGEEVEEEEEVVEEEEEAEVA